MQFCLQRKKRIACLILAAVLMSGSGAALTGCGAKIQETKGETIGTSQAGDSAGGVSEQKEALRYELDPETFSLSVARGEKEVPVSFPMEARRVENLREEGEKTEWDYPDNAVSVSVEPVRDYLQVTITSTAETDNEFSWPGVEGDSYQIPIGEGKRIPADDAVWGSHLDGRAYSALEQLSMPFWASVHGESAVTVILENPYRSDLNFSSQPSIRFTLSHRYPEIDPEKSNRFRIYLTDSEPVSTAKVYRQYKEEKGELVKMEEKASQNPNIRKLYGAPHIYLWGDNLIAPEQVKWPALRQSLSGNVMNYVMGFAAQTESGAEAGQMVEAVKKQDYVDQYQKNILCRFLSEVLKNEEFYDSSVFEEQDETMTELLKKGVGQLNDSEILQLNKHALAVNLPEVFAPAGEWMNNETVDLLEEMKVAGIDRAFIGLPGWEQAYAKPELVEKAADIGYLAASYDSYHSIHEPGKEQWSTAAFEDVSLYDNASVTGPDGTKNEGFKGVGRKLNPVLAFPAVKQRTGEIMSTEIPFNSWFIDCDATGEIYDDYTPEHVTLQQQDLKARLERMAYIRDQYGLVVGSEGGNDFAAPVIAFAHGIELGSFSWMDPDMKKNKDSEYYIGKYYNPTGGVAEHFSKRIPVKEKYYTVFLDPRYDLPLYKLVYNDSVITAYHWDWSTFKVKGAVQDRMLREVLYNTPPLYHLDRTEWEKYREEIVSHHKVWSQFSREAATKEMTGFQYLVSDGSVQRTEYAEGLAVTANFSDSAFNYEGNEIPGHSLLLQMNGEEQIYTPYLSEDNR